MNSSPFEELTLPPYFFGRLFAGGAASLLAGLAATTFFIRVVLARIAR